MPELPSKSLEQVIALVAEARAAGRVKTVRKTRPVDARPARPGEVVVTVINGEKETQSPPAKSGDWVVRNRCPETGNEEYLIRGDKFDAKYRRSGVPGADGWQECRPVDKKRRALILTPQEGSFTFTAPWGEPMVAHPGDVLVQDPDDEHDTYRVAKAAFACTYEVLA
jgi:hypothetical protein